MDHYLQWCGKPIPFVPGEMLSFTLLRECKNSAEFGESTTGQAYGLFCGIGACQGCLVNIKGRGSVEACLTPSAEDLEVGPARRSAGHST